MIAPISKELAAVAATRPATVIVPAEIPGFRRRFVLLQLKARLGLELRGMTGRVSLIQVAKRWGFTGRTKQQALDWVLKELEAYDVPT